MVLCGPSGAAKSSVRNLVREYYPWVHFAVSCTTRGPRPGEIDGADYHFVSTDRFESMIAAGELLEWSSHAGNLYGTPRGPIEASLRSGVPVLAMVDLHGARRIRSVAPRARQVVVAPPARREPTGRRGAEDDAGLERRPAAAREEPAAEFEFDHTVANVSLEQAAAKLLELLIAPTADRPGAF